MNNSNPFAAFSHLDEGMIAAVIIGVVIGMIIGLTIMIFYLLNLQNALKQCAPQNQKMPPGQVWLALIPLFGTVWHFIMVARIADSLAAELQMRGVPPNEERPGYKVGMAYCILSACTYIQYLGIPGIGQLCGLAGFVCWIVYWVKIAGYKKQLMEHQQFAFGNPNPYPFPNAPVNPNQYANQPPSPYSNQPPNPYYNQPPNQGQGPFQPPQQ